MLENLQLKVLSSNNICDFYIDYLILRFFVFNPNRIREFTIESFVCFQITFVIFIQMKNQRSVLSNLAKTFWKMPQVSILPISSIVRCLRYLSRRIEASPRGNNVSGVLPPPAPAAIHPLASNFPQGDEQIA